MNIFSEVKVALAALEGKINPDHFDPALSRAIDRCISILENMPPAEDTP